MPILPRDLADLYLSPIVLALDNRIDDLGRLDRDELATRVAAVTDMPDWTSELRRDALLRCLERFVDLHDWTISWHPRGLQVSHNSFAVVLGVPASFAGYVSGRTAAVGAHL